MYTTESTLVQSTRERALMLDNLLRVLSYRCWESDDDTPTEYVSEDVLVELQDVLNSAQAQLKELQTATHILSNNESNPRTDAHLCAISQ